MKNFLFICGQNKLRSPTAENIFSEYQNLNVRSAGVNPDAEHIVDADDIEWTEYIFVMEKIHKDKLLRMFGNLIKNQKVVVLNIADRYRYMDEELINILKNKLDKWM